VFPRLRAAGTRRPKPARGMNDETRRSPSCPRRPHDDDSIPRTAGHAKIEQQGFDFASYGLSSAPSRSAHPVADEVSPAKRKRRTRSSAPSCGPASSDRKGGCAGRGAKRGRVQALRWKTRESRQIAASSAALDERADGQRKGHTRRTRGLGSGSRPARLVRETTDLCPFCPFSAHLGWADA